ncbi:MAG: sodium:solute symporter [Candidatus Marinimicrobia bacterium]|nr:sodium:solute symporter [Candidatus Neomarinimicrobiota bacterium]MCH7954429.1 sodium:solute symporter [Candidatus Neomarinimicrobiota bacterium]
MTELGFLSLIPPLVAIGFAMWTRQVYLSLFLGLLVGYTILAGWNPLIGFGDSLEALLKVFESESNSAVIIFSVLMGVLINYTQSSGGVKGFVQWLENRGFVKSRRSAGFLAWTIGMVVFVETNITCLVTGTVCRPVFDRHKISREKLAYIVDSTSSPVCIMLPLNAWGAFIVGLLAEQGIESPVKVFVQAIPLNFYAILALLLVVVVIITQKDIGPMKDAEKRAMDSTNDEYKYRSSSSELGNIKVVEGVTPRAINMILPIATMVLMMPVGLYVTGGGDILNGSGSKSVLLAVTVAVFLAAVLYRVQGIMKLPELSAKFIEGGRALMPMAIIMMLAFAIGNLTKEMGTGIYVANAIGSSVSYIFIPPILFIVSSAISFSTGTSWGTFAIMIPIAIPLVIQTGGTLPLALAAVLGGGVFGDHCSPISDTTIISSLASMSDHIEHVKTQLPYALIAGAATTLLFTIAAAF